MKRIFLITAIFFVFVVLSHFLSFELGIEMGKSYLSFIFSLVKIVPFAFVLIGLFEVWVKKETIEKHLGEGSRLKGYFWALILAATTVGGLFVALPVAATLSRKGARLGVVLTYLAASAVCRLPMTLFEASYLGLKFTFVRYIVSLPLIIITSEIMAKLIPDMVINER